MKRLSIYYNVLRYGFRNKYTRAHAKYRTYPYSKDNANQLIDFLASSPSRDAVAFVGLKQVRHSMGVEDPYSYLKEVLANTFDTLIVPTFTPSVKETGVFDVHNTQSENGIFSQLFMRQTELRTLSPFKSFSVQGLRANEIMQLQTSNDYAADGVFCYLNSPNHVSINIGTINPRFSTIHFCEYKSSVPYIFLRSIKVNIKNHSGVKEENMYFYLDYKYVVRFNRDKLERDLMKAGILARLVINNLVVRIIPEQRAYQYMLERIKKDPYYLVD